MPILYGKGVRAGCQVTSPGRKFHLNKSPTGPQFVNSRKARPGQFQLEIAFVQPDREVAFKQFGVGRGFIRRDHAIPIAVNQTEHLFRDGYTRREIHLQADTVGFDPDKRRLQILVQAVRKSAKW